MPDSFEISDLMPASPRRVYEAWLDSKAHTEMTGGAARVNPRKGGKFSAWDGYITGKNLELEPGRRILQAWRTSEFPQGSPDSRLEVLLEPAKGGARITLRHTEIPDGQGGSYLEGWKAYYFEPMKRYFSG